MKGVNHMKSRVLQVVLGILVVSSLVLTFAAVGDDYETDRRKGRTGRYTYVVPASANIG
jgi:hypothetical protein